MKALAFLVVQGHCNERTQNLVPLFSLELFKALQLIGPKEGDESRKVHPKTSIPDSHVARMAAGFTDGSKCI